MNYRHAYHAGNHTEVFKHSVLCQLLLELLKKPTPFTVLDTHAGAGRYDLQSAKSRKTGEAQNGIGIVINKDIPITSRYLDIVRSLNADGLHYYPGSPTIIQALLREDDRLIACELRKDDVAILRANFKGDRRISVHCRNGFEAIGAFVPLPTRRGLVFIDPPFEQRDEFETLADQLNAGIKKWPTGIFAAWYPLKDRSGIQIARKLYRSKNPPTLCCEFLREPIDGLTLAGSGLVICNPPWRLDEKLAKLCSSLASAFNAPKAQWSIDWWIKERGSI